MSKGVHCHAQTLCRDDNTGDMLHILSGGVCEDCQIRHVRKALRHGGVNEACSGDHRYGGGAAVLRLGCCGADDICALDRVALGVLIVTPFSVVVIKFSTVTVLLAGAVSVIRRGK